MPTINGRACVVNGTPVDKVFSNGRQVYGRNLAIGTGQLLSIAGTNAANQWAYNYSLVNGYNVSSLASAFGTQYTFSFDWSVSGSSPSGKFKAQFNDDPWYLGRQVTVSSSNTSGHISYTFSLSSVSTDNKNVATLLGFRLDNFVGTFTAFNVKLEKGSVATPWTPAPEDVGVK
jgi:hypothetical protein